MNKILKFISQLPCQKGVSFLLITFSFYVVIVGCQNNNTIEIPDDAPDPWAPEEAVKSFQLAPGFRIELVASEPLISDPTGVCWDEEGYLYVCELHGYNLPGQLEIEDMNESGKLDTIVQRVQAADKYYREAEMGTYGQIKRLIDTNGDGVMDKAELFADNLPPTYGLTAARGGFIVAGQKEVLYVADSNGDGKADIRDTLFTGWEEFELERGLSSPQWGMDGWIYFGAGVGTVEITGPYLKEPVHLPPTDFRIRADGSAIEPVTGTGGTIGFAISPDGYKFNNHSTYSIPIEWKYLVRNPNTTIARLTANPSDYKTVFSIAPVHPWRITRSSGDWGKYYTERYNKLEATVSGYFTGESGPMIYNDDSLFPDEFTENLFVCEPAGQLVHRAIIEKHGTELKVRRADNEQDKEFLASKDTWFSPVALTQGPDGSIYITDFYREIIEDYSAVPRPMQQLYQLNHGMDKGRIWRVSPETSQPLESLERLDFRNVNLEDELDSPHFWSRQTSNRLLYEQKGDQTPAFIKRQIKLSDLESTTAERDFIKTLRLQDENLKTDVVTARKLATMVKHISNERKLLQLALSLGYSQDESVFNSLIYLAKYHGNIRWMSDAILTGVQNRAGNMLIALLADPGQFGQNLLEPLGANISARGDHAELSVVINAISKLSSSILQVASLKGIISNLQPFELDHSTITALNKLLQSDSQSVCEQAVAMALKLDVVDSKELNNLLEKASNDVSNSQLSIEERLNAVALLSNSRDQYASKSLIPAWATATPPLKTAILEGMISRGNRISAIIDAIESRFISVDYLTPLQRDQLIERANSKQRELLESLFSTINDSNMEKNYAKYIQGLEGSKANIENGGKIFERMCSSCHQVNNIGIEVGPDLERAYSSSKEMLLHDILWPSAKITSGYETFLVHTANNEEFSGVLVSETSNSVVLRQVGGFEKTFQRKNIKKLSSSQTSLMPSFKDALSPEDCADVIEWLRISMVK